MSTAERKEREKLRRRNEIVDAAEKLFFSKGNENVTMDDIAKHTELARGTLYLYFKNKDDINAAIAVRGVKILNRMFRETCNARCTGIEKIKSILCVLYDFRKKYPGYYTTIWYLQSSGFGTKDFPDKGELESTHMDNFRIVIEAFGEGIRDGTVRGDVDPAKTSLFFTSSMQNALSLAPGVDPDPAKQDEFVDYSIELLLRSVEKK